MKQLEDFYERCYCGKILMKQKNVQETPTSLVYECEKCEYTYTILLEQLLEA